MQLLRFLECAENTCDCFIVKIARVFFLNGNECNKNNRVI